MISPSSAAATSMDRAVLPVAVGPVMTSASALMRRSRGLRLHRGACGGSPVPAEPALQLLEREPDDRRPAVHVVGRQLGREEAIEQLVHLGSREWLARLDRGL